MKSLWKWVAWDLQTILVCTFYILCKINDDASSEVLCFSVIIAWELGIVVVSKKLQFIIIY